MKKSCWFLIGAIFASLVGCGVLPRFEREEAVAAIPLARSYALENIPNLNEDDRKFIQTVTPAVGHSNYVEYHYRWMSKENKVLYAVQTNPPELGSGFISASKVN